MTGEQHFADGCLRLTRDAGIARLRLHQPERRNAISQAMWEALPVVVETVEADPAIRVLVLSGAGEQAFSAGADISQFARVYAHAETAAVYNAAVRRGQAVVRACRLPVIAEIHGVCMGGGLGLALACDLRFAAADARFAITPAKLGLAYSFADTRQLVEIVGPARAKDILFSARTLLATEALAIGLIDRAVDPAGLRAEVDGYCRRMLELSATSIGLSKMTINAIADGLVEPPQALAEAIAASFAGADFHEGFSAFLAKQKPNFSEH